jgi:hypothetical protein
MGQAGSPLNSVAWYVSRKADRSGSGRRMPTTPCFEINEYMLPLMAVYADPKFDFSSTPSVDSSNC